MAERRSVRVIRSHIRLWTGGAVASIAGALGLFALEDLVLGEPSRSALGGFAIFTTVAASLAVALVRRRLVVSEAGVHVVNPLRVTFVPWAAMEALALGPTRLGPSLQIVEKTGRRVSVVAVQPPGIIPQLLGRHSFLDEVTTDLHELAQKHQLSKVVPDPRTARAGRTPLLLGAAAYAVAVFGLLLAGLVRT